ncbi:pseudomurein-binding repeat-containing protein [Methanobacterium oryzae]|uniref:pseudomurein-binding repeat-containing protein n=1 Tax=Methanobacterium oryzae TaxID=69540 RepID=UPI003D2270B1
MLLICCMAMSTIGSSFAAASSGQTADNIVNTNSNIENTINNQNPVENLQNNSTDTQDTLNTNQTITDTASETSVTQQSTQSTSNTYLNSQNPVNTETNTQNTAGAVNVTTENSVNSDSNTVSNQISTNISEEQAAAGDNYTNVRGIWIKAEDVGNISLSELKSANITDVFVKTNLISSPTYKSVLTTIIGKLQNSGIRIHAWITCFKDANGNWIDPSNATQRTFLLNGITDILSFSVNGYGVDGIHLDYVRYSGVGDNAAYNYSNATTTITSFISQVKQLIISKKPKTALSASVMPEGANNAYYYGQDYGQLAKYLDFLVPMIYKGNYGQNSTWIGTTTKYIVDHAVNANGIKIPVIAGLQTYISDYDTSLITADELNQDIKSATDNGASGYVLFRYGMISQDFLKPPSFTLSQIKDAAARVKAFIETNKMLPNFVTIGTTPVKMSDFLKLMTTSVIQLNSGKTTAITLQNVFSPTNSTGSFKAGNINKAGYLDIANRINSYIKANGLAPNYATTNLGKIPYESLVYMYTKILNFSKTNNYLPSYVSMSPTMKIASPKVSTISTTTFSLDQIKKAATSVKTYIDTNKALPNYLTVGTEQVKITDFLRLLLIGTIEINEGSKAPISLKTVNASATPIENITNGTIDETGYIDLAKRVKAFIDANGAIPNHATTTLGEMKFESLVYTFSKILNFYDTNSRLPSYVSVDPWSKVSTSSMQVPDELLKYLAATTNCQVNDPKIKALAASITAGKTTAYAKAVAIFNWVRDNIGYSFYYNTKYGAVGTLNAKTGNCVDTSHLLIALSRAAGLPAMYVHGTCQFTSGSWYGHVWARIWVDGKWYAADATSSRNTFGVVNNWNTATYTLKGTYASLPF